MKNKMFSDLIETRRSIRKYLPDPVEPEKIEILAESALRAPSSMSRNPWEFIVVTDQELIKRLAQSKEHGASFLKGAPLAIIVCADPQKCDVWVEDVSIASIFIHLTSHDMGLGSCWIQIRDRMHNCEITSETYVRQTLGIPEKLKVESIIAIGYPDEQKPSHSKDSLSYQKIHFNKYGQPYF